MSKLKLMEKMQKINQEDLAKVLGTNRVQISRYETGNKTKINRQNTPRGFRAACLSVL